MCASFLGGKKMNYGLIALIIFLVVIIGSIFTKRCAEFMIGGTFVAAIILYKGSFLTKWCEILQETVADNVWILVVCGLFGSLVALLQASNGSFGFAKLVSKFCKNEKRTLLTTFVMGVLIFVDDYLNVLSIGTCMKGVYDKRKIPRETLAYIWEDIAILFMPPVTKFWQ